jgi:FdrA protein
MSATTTRVRQHTYVDSVTLLQLTAEVLALPNVENAALVMATELNRDVLRDASLLVGEAIDAGTNDLVIAVRAETESAARAALAEAEALLTRRRAGPTGSSEEHPPRSLRSARRAMPVANLAVISVPGRYAAAEARLALADGMHVFLFSDNVALDDEVQLKQSAREHGLLVMGPDCGTAILNGVGFGFANVVRRGAVGIVGASGTGIQEVTSLVHQAGQGISHAIGTGSRDLHSAVGGITTLQAIDLLRDDAGTERIVLVSKPSEPRVAERVLRALADTGKPAVAYLQGSAVQMPENVRTAQSLAEAASLAAGAALHEIAVSQGLFRRAMRGLFCGGTLAQEARALLGEGNDIIDFGDDQYTRGRAHPMIDPTLRNEAIVRAGRDRQVAVLLLDFILGLGAHADPVGAAVAAIREAINFAQADGRGLSVVAHVVGTDLDPQGLARQEKTLRAAGVQVFGSNAAAASAVSQILAGVAA